MEPCAICWDKINENDKICLACNHEYHQSCITRWMARSRTCPMCREVIHIHAQPPPPPVFEEVRLHNILARRYTSDGSLYVPLTNMTYRCNNVAWAVGARWYGDEHLWFLRIDSWVIPPAILHQIAPFVDTGEQIRLDVKYEDRERAKNLGARWNPATKVWWTPMRLGAAWDLFKPN